MPVCGSPIEADGSWIWSAHQFYTSELEPSQVADGGSKGQPWATTLTVVDKLSQNVSKLAVRSKSAKRDSYLGKSAIDFVKRMACMAAELRTDGEPAVTSLAEEIRKPAAAAEVRSTLLRLRAIVVPVSAQMKRRRIFVRASCVYCFLISKCVMASRSLEKMKLDHVLFSILACPLRDSTSVETSRPASE